jgi:hypothetical protein
MTQADAELAAQQERLLRRLYVSEDASVEGVPALAQEWRRLEQERVVPIATAAAVQQLRGRDPELRVTHR